MGLNTLFAALGVATIAAAAPLSACEFEAAETSRPVVLAEAQSGTQLNGIRVNGVRPNGIRVNGLSRNGAPATGSAAQGSDPNGVADRGGFQPLTVILPDGRGLIAE